ncbi:MAG: membrane-associated phospholipid phosphatase [Bacteroidia bacterium]|jgi:membrane-associated phospholipid phosphatase
MKHIAAPARIFLLLTILWMITLGTAELVYGRHDLHLLINGYHWPFADSFFRYLTHFGSGFAPLILAVSLLFVKIRWALFVGLANGLASLIVQSAKHGLFSHMKRPTALLSEQLHLPPGIDFHAHNSFPSGHSATAFCLGMCLMLIAKDSKWALPAGILFSLTAFSRVYLSQHFSGDVAVGSMIGTLCALLAFWIMNRINVSRLDKGILGR